MGRRSMQDYDYIVVGAGGSTTEEKYRACPPPQVVTDTAAPLPYILPRRLMPVSHD
jgi:hypothetical protein